MIEILVSVIGKMSFDKERVRVKMESEVHYIICYYHRYTYILMEMHGAVQKSN